jgi:hypothetical protein
MGRRGPHIKNTVDGVSLPCRVSGCSTPPISRGLCPFHYGQAKRGVKLILWGSGSGTPETVAWVYSPAPAVPERAPWTWDGDEESLIEADEKTSLKSEETKEHANDRQY